MMQLSETAALTGGVLNGADRDYEAVCTDTREDLAGKLFIALRGERFDAHAFIAQAAAQGAAGALVEQACPHEKPDGFPTVSVPDTRLALGSLAAAWRRRFDLPLIGVTGSNGKTTVKEMCAAILRAWYPGKDAVLATQGNLNNDIGVPQMLLRLRSQHRAAVIEMGMNHPGEIAYLAEMVAPTVAVVNNAQRAHLAGMGALDAVAREKGELFAALSEAGQAAINIDDPHADYWQALCAPRRGLTFGFNERAQIRASHKALAFGSSVVLQTPWGETNFTLDVPGQHNVRNAAAAAAATLAAGAPLDAVSRGLNHFSGAKGRLQVRHARGGAVVLDDTYNANPDSMRAAIDVLAASAGKKILVLGDMGEIGEMSAQCHDEIGGYAKSQGVDRLFALGEHSALAARNFGAGGEHFSSIDELVAALEPALAPDVVVLVKGSRFMRMERVADALAMPLNNTTKV